MKITLDPQTSVPPERQIVQAIADRIRKGRLKPGDPLPVAADLAKALNLKTSEVETAYRLLVRENMAVSATEGGLSVSERQNVVGPGRKERAMSMIDQTISKLKRMKFSYQEIRSLIDLRIMAKEERLANFAVAGIDINPESLAILEQQIGAHLQTQVARFLLDDLRVANATARQLDAFDLILTPPAHLDAVKALAPRLKGKMLPVVVSPEQGTIIKLAGLSASRRIGIFCESKSFMQALRDRLIAMGLPSANISHRLVKDEDQLPAFLTVNDVILVPQGYALLKRREHAAAMQAFRQRGGKIIVLKDQIERGSLLLVEDRMRTILNG